jgi:hypothetical protein
VNLIPPTLLLLAAFGPSDLFRKPLPIWNAWPWLLLPLVIGVSVVYKSVKCKSMKQVPREASVIALWILIGIAGAAAALAGVVKVLEH